MVNTAVCILDPCTLPSNTWRQFDRPRQIDTRGKHTRTCTVLYCITMNTKKVLHFGMEEPLPNPPPPTRPITSTVFSMILLSTCGWLGWHTKTQGASANHPAVSSDRARSRNTQRLARTRAAGVLAFLPSRFSTPLSNLTLQTATLLLVFRAFRQAVSFPPRETSLCSE